MKQPLASCLYEGWVEHWRSPPRRMSKGPDPIPARRASEGTNLVPSGNVSEGSLPIPAQSAIEVPEESSDIRAVEHRFRYRICFAYLDLSELDSVFEGRWLWSTKKWGIVRFDRRDHFGDPQQPLEDSVRDLVESHGIRRPRGPIRLLTHLRFCEYVFNPVSFYFVYSEDGKAVEQIVASVMNTPWKERHQYLLTPAHFQAPQKEGVRLEKAFHVSPFLPMNLYYTWRIDPPGPRLGVEIIAKSNDSARSGSGASDGKSVFEVTMQLVRREISSKSLASALVRFPLMAQQVIAGIYWQAFRLWWKGAKFHSHPRHIRT